MKRLFDCIVSVFALVLFFPLFVLVSIGILLLDGPPVFFRQTRVGLAGHDFVLNKFRTMTVARGTGSGSFDAGDRSRVTAVGRVLRKSKMDELPQIWNVLKGDMSVVGPRPEVRKWVDTYPERWARVLTVKPGITDPASIVYRNEEDILAMADDPEACYREKVLPHKLDLYEEYVRTRTFWGDIMIIFRTLLTVLLPGRFSFR